MSQHGGEWSKSHSSKDHCFDTDPLVITPEETLKLIPITIKTPKAVYTKIITDLKSDDPAIADNAFNSLAKSCIAVNPLSSSDSPAISNALIASGIIPALIKRLSTYSTTTPLTTIGLTLALITNLSVMVAPTSKSALYNQLSTTAAVEAMMALEVS